MQTESTVRNEYRDVMAAILRSEPQAKEVYKTIKKLKLEGGRPEFWGAESSLKVWFFHNERLFVAMIRLGENDWSLLS